ncbi:MAG TPA: hypothetical protein P5333_09715, partial [Caldilinea sp.]|nr:hypothetical protein [Caldilinea sp.]
MSLKLDPYDVLLERAMLALYLQWPYLPRRATLPTLETLRKSLAAELAGMTDSPDQERFQTAARDFAGAALALPGVRAIAGADLTKLAASAETRPGLRTALTISNAGVTSDRVRELAAMLDTPDPPASAIGRRFYKNSSLPQAWDDIRPAVETLLDRLPADARTEVEAIDRDLQSALRNTTRFDVRPYEVALLRLEAIPGVVAALADRFVRWKSVEKEKTLTLANPRGSESMIASAAAAPPMADLATIDALVVAPPETLEVNFHTDVKFPARLQRNKVEWLVVRLRLEEPAETVAAGLVPVEFTQQGNEPPPPEYLTVRVLASDFDEETRVWERTITVHHDRDSDPAVFLLKAAELGKKRITIDFEHKGRPVGSVWFMTEVVDTPASSASVTLARSPDDLPEFARFERNPPPPADVQLRVVKKSGENTLAFWLN